MAYSLSLQNGMSHQVVIIMVAILHHLNLEQVLIQVSMRSRASLLACRHHRVAAAVEALVVEVAQVVDLAVVEAAAGSQILPLKKTFIPK